MHQSKNDEALDRYVEFCVTAINHLLAAIRQNLASGRWTTDSKVPNRALTTTYINSFLIVLRLLIEKHRPITDEALKAGFAKINEFDFKDYHSSQYARMAAKIVELHFTA